MNRHSRRTFRKRFVSSIILALALSACTVPDTPAASEVQASATPIQVTLSPSSRATVANATKVAALGSSSQTIPNAPTAAPSHTATSVVTGTPTLTRTPSLTPSPSATEDVTFDTNPMVGPLVGFVIEDLTGSWFLLVFDVGTSRFRTLKSDVASSATTIKWLRRGCEIDIGGSVIDLQGNLVWQLPEIQWDDLLPEDAWGIGETWLSPEKEWLAYSVLAGDQTFFDAEFVDIGTYRLDGSRASVLLSQRGGAKKAAWSPDGQWLAFSDYDDQGVLQVYRAAPDGTLIQQLTSHNEPLSSIGYLVWSPSSQRVAYAVKATDHDEGDTGWVGIISTADMSAVSIAPDDFSGVRGTALFWSADGTRIMFAGRSPEHDSPTAMRIYWADVDTGGVLDSFPAADTPAGAIELVFAAGSIDRVLFSGGGGLYMLNIANRSCMLLNELGLDDSQLVREAAGAPLEFPGEANCRE